MRQTAHGAASCRTDSTDPHGTTRGGTACRYDRKGATPETAGSWCMCRNKHGERQRSEARPTAAITAQGQNMWLLAERQLPIRGPMQKQACPATKRAGDAQCKHADPSHTTRADDGPDHGYQCSTARPDGSANHGHQFCQHAGDPTRCRSTHTATNGRNGRATKETAQSTTGTNGLACISTSR